MFLLKKDMKNFAKYIICLLFFFNISDLRGAEVVVEEEIVEKPTEGIKTIANRDYSVSEYAVLLARYFNNHYKGDKIEEDFTEELEKFFPDVSLANIYSAETWIRRAVKAYREGKEFYQKLITEINMKPTKRIFPDEDYDDDTFYDYIDTGKPDEYIVITDIKRVLAYGDNPQDLELMQAKKDHDAGIERGSVLDELKKLKKIWDEGRYKEIFFFGSDEGNYEKSLGIGNYAHKNEIITSLITNYTAIKNPDKIKTGLLISVPEDKFITAENSGTFIKPQIDLSASENLSSYKINLPVPTRFNYSDGQSFGVYGKIFLIPFNFKITDNKKPVILRAKTNLQICDYFLNCENIETHNELTLNVGESVESDASIFIYQAFNHISGNDGVLAVNKAVIDEDYEGHQSLRIEFSHNKRVRSFSVFAEDEKSTKFKAPLTAVEGDTIFVRFETEDNTQKIDDSKFFVRAMLNGKYAFMDTITAKKGIFFDPKAMTFSFGILAVAFLGGFLLNFMPCIFPVLSLKVIALSRLENESSKNIKRSIFLSICGILGGFFILSTLLCTLKLLGYSLGWGMQFQSIGFLGFMMFIILLFFAELEGIINIKTPDFINKHLSNNAQKNDFLSVMTGAFVVLMATPCSAPFLGVAVGFALSGKIIHIYLILTAVAFGLCLPYFLILFIPQISCKFPSGATWRKRFIFIMELMLIATLLWLFSIMSAQIGIIKTALFLLLLILLICVFWLAQKFTAYINSNTENASLYSESKNFINKFFLIFFAIVAFVAFSYLHYTNKKAHAEYAEKNRPEQIDFAEIKKNIDEGKIVVLEIGANWCLTCKLNEFTVLNFLKKNTKDTNVVYLRIDWSRYNKDILDFMAKYGRRGLPFYVVFSKTMPDGIALPEILTASDIEAITNKRIIY